jgi:hypothetical protein
MSTYNPILAAYIGMGTIRESSAPVPCSDICTASHATPQNDTLTTCCKHVFHRACLVQYLSHGFTTCPKCDTSLRPASAGVSMDEAARKITEGVSMLEEAGEDAKKAARRIEKQARRTRENQYRLAIRNGLGG